MDRDLKIILEVLAAHCTGTPDCDLTAAHEAFDRLVSLQAQLDAAMEGLEDAAGVICGEFCSPRLRGGLHHVVCAAASETLARIAAIKAAGCE